MNGRFWNRMEEAADPTGENGGGDGGAAKPYLGGGSGEGSGEGKKLGGGDGGAAQATDDDYIRAFVKDEVLLGDDKDVQLDAELAKGVLPTARELGVSPQAFSKLANALAKAQVERAREDMKARVDYFNRMKEESVRRYSQRDFAKINAAIDHHFKPGGIMNSVIRNSELGADPEFLALMRRLGDEVAEDTSSGSAAGGGGAPYDPNSIADLAKMWK